MADDGRIVNLVTTQVAGPGDALGDRPDDLLQRRHDLTGQLSPSPALIMAESQL
jgi:hypothetical protein